jgi:hypothetical protein
MLRRLDRTGFTEYARRAGLNPSEAECGELLEVSAGMFDLLEAFDREPATAPQRMPARRDPGFPPRPIPIRSMRSSAGARCAPTATESCPASAWEYLLGHDSVSLGDIRGAANGRDEVGFGGMKVGVISERFQASEP